MNEPRRDICIIGAGIIGTTIARRLSRYKLNITLIEKADDVAMGATKANSAIVHGGYAESNSKLKGRLCYQGRKQFADLDKELHFGFEPIGSLVLTSNEDDLPKLKALEENGRKNGLTDLKILTGDEIRAMEPSIHPDIRYGLYCEGAGICSPYGMAIAMAENAVQNGVELSLNEEILAIRKDEDGYVLTTNKREIPTRYVINCAGIHSAEIAAMVHEPHFSIHPRSGEYILCNKDTGKLLNKVAFQMPSAMGKGILVTPTIHGNLLIGPDAVNVEGADRSTHVDRLVNIFDQALLTTPDLDSKWFLRSFAGIRAVSSTDDFIIEESVSPGFFHAAGIQSPGLTSSPAIADMMVELLENAGCVLEEDPNYDPIRKPLPHLDRRLTPAEIKERLETIGPDQIICRCEQVPRAVIEETLKRGIPINSVDAIKRRTRASMGACQGGFCRSRYLKVVKEVTGRELDPRTDIEKEGLQRVNRAEFLTYYNNKGADNSTK